MQLIEQKELEVSVNVYFKAEEVGQDMTPWKKLHNTVSFRNSWDVIKYCSQYCYGPVLSDLLTVKACETTAIV